MTFWIVEGGVPEIIENKDVFTIWNRIPTRYQLAMKNAKVPRGDQWSIYNPQYLQIGKQENLRPICKYVASWAGIVTGSQGRRFDSYKKTK